MPFPPILCCLASMTRAVYADTKRHAFVTLTPIPVEVKRMPRRARIRAAGIPLHVIQRGHDRRACFFADEDYRFYLHQLAELSRRFECPVHAYVLMTNHVHILVTPATDEGASLLMKNLGQRYVQYINRVYQRRGTLWEGRFRSCFVDRLEYFLKCHHYIELNPVRAGMVRHPSEYRWSSYRSNAEARSSKIIQPHDEYLALGSTEDERCAAYRDLCRCDLDPEDLKQIRSAATGNFALGNDRFRQDIEVMIGRSVTRQRQSRFLPKGTVP
jgi:putative transposase